MGTISGFHPGDKLPLIGTTRSPRGCRMLRRRMFAFHLPSALVTLRRKIQDSVKQSVHRVEQVDLAKQVNWFCEQSFHQHEFPQILFRRAHGPEKISVGHTLPRPLHAHPYAVSYTHLTLP